MMHRSRLLVMLLMAVSCHTLALEPRSDHTFGLAEGESVPAFSLDDLHWIVGSWTGTIFGQNFEEVWNPPSAGSMMGMYKVLKSNDVVDFYEMELITETENGIALMVKHFSAGFESWEEKTEFANFPLVGIETDAIHFEGLSYYRQSDDRITAYILLNFGGEVREEQILLERRSL